MKKEKAHQTIIMTADVLKQIICAVKIRCDPIRQDTIDFHALITKVSAILPLSVVTADKAYNDGE